MIDYDEKDVKDFSALELPGEEVIEEEDEYIGEDDEDTVVVEGTLAVRIQAMLEEYCLDEDHLEVLRNCVGYGAPPGLIEQLGETTGVPVEALVLSCDDDLISFMIGEGMRMDAGGDAMVTIEDGDVFELNL